MSDCFQGHKDCTEGEKLSRPTHGLELFSELRLRIPYLNFARAPHASTRDVHHELRSRTGKKMKTVTIGSNYTPNHG